ncbi:MAG: hypothetical protein J6O99_08195 [Methanobrevibacter sp.]|nr:hypothetical protein [Methanobrevibacter sp.]
MKQYCRYCGYCIAETDFVGVSWCDKKQKEMSTKSAKTENHCKDFLFCEIDAFNPENKYKPRQKKPVDNSQQSLFEGM